MENKLTKVYAVIAQDKDNYRRTLDYFFSFDKAKARRDEYNAIMEKLNGHEIARIELVYIKE